MKVVIFCFIVATGIASTAAVCFCTLDYKPVCGSDLKTYSNECVFNCAKQESEADLSILKLGVCEEEEPNVEVAAEKEMPEICRCPKIFRPVCASNRQLYSNECEFNCAKKQRADLRQVDRSFCKS